MSATRTATYQFISLGKMARFSQNVGSSVDIIVGSRGYHGVSQHPLTGRRARCFSSQQQTRPLCSNANSSSALPRWRLLEGASCTTLEEYLAMSSASKTVVSSASSTSEWQEDCLRASGDLAESLGIDPSRATGVEHRRVFHLYLPVFLWLKDLLRLNQDSGEDAGGTGKSEEGAEAGPVVVGLSAPQGCGKTTLVEEMRRMLEKAGHSCAVLSIDDFYLTRKEQNSLAAAHPENPLLQLRGNAGTHDLALGLDTIRALKKSPRKSSRHSNDSNRENRDGGSKSTEETIVRVPRYDKSAGGGRGDRAPAEDWVEVVRRPDVVLLEGWMLGFEALPDDSDVLAQADKSGGADRGLREVNTFLKNYGELHGEVDAWLVLKTADPDLVFEWRAEAERKMRDSGKSGMSEEEVRDFCSRYMPCYRAYLPGLYELMEGKQVLLEEGSGHVGIVPPGKGGDFGHALDEHARIKALVIEVGQDRNPV